MLFGDKRYNTIDHYLKNKFGRKTVKLSIDGGFSCPNRDGSIGKKGCIFCSEKGSGDFTSGRELNIDEQINKQIYMLQKKWENTNYLAYFQSFTNTYASKEMLYSIYDQVLKNPKISGICIATRPDCIDEEVLEVLDYLNKNTFLWIELGFQTSNENSARLIRRGYKNKVFLEACEKLNNINVKTVAHMILNLPDENKKDYFDTLEYIINAGVWGIKYHMLYILKNTDIEKYYRNEGIEFMSIDEYVETIVELVARTPKEIVIHRITGDAPSELLVEPKWSRNKIYIIGNVEKKLKEKKLYQGALIK